MALQPVSPERVESIPESGETLPIIRIEHLVKRYPGTDFNAVDGLDLTVMRGEIFGLLGPNGAGKTTTAGTTKVRTIDGGVEIHVTHADRLLPRIIAAAEEVGVEIADVSVAEPTLETVFIDLTGKELRA